MRKAMIVAAGLGTRLKPLTDNLPKALVRVGEKPLLRMVIDRLASFGYDDIVVNVHHFADMVEGYLRAEGLLTEDPAGLMDESLAGGSASSTEGLRGRVRISDERDLLRDTGGGIRHAAAQILDNEDAPCRGNTDVLYQDNEDAPCRGNTDVGRFLVHNVDILSNMDLNLFDNSFPPDALALLAVSERKTSRYLLFDENMRLVGWTNVSTGEVRSPYPDLDLSSCRQLAFSGIQMISTGIFGLFESEAMGEKFSIIDFYLRVAAKCPIYGIIPENLHLLDVGKTEILEKLNSDPSLLKDFE